jgi:cytochrome c
MVLRRSICVLAMLWTTAAIAAGASLERGKNIFESRSLGTNGRSCATCHRDGKDLDFVSSYDDGKLAGIVNNCIKKPLAGTPLQTDSEEMKSLLLYLRSIAK